MRVMRYSYGDSSESPFTSNFLELLRDAIDFAVYVVEADQRMLAAIERVDARRSETETEIAQLDALKRAVVATIDSTTTTESAESAVKDCALRMAEACAETVQASAARLEQRLVAEIATADAEDVTERNGCHGALLALLAEHVPPESSSVLRLLYHEDGYEARREGEWPAIGLSYQCQLAVPSGHPFSHLLRVEALQHRLEIGAPEQTGWLRKEVKIRPQHLERHVISEAVAEGQKIVLRLRTEPGSETGFDLEYDAEHGSIAASRVVADHEQPDAGPFEVRDEDAPRLIELCTVVRANLTGLKTVRLDEAKLADTDFRAVPHFREIAEGIVGYLSPFVHEIAKHSLEPDELVLRRQLGDDRREEIFVSKSTLRQKYEGLEADQAALFEPLALRQPLSRSLLPVAGHREPATRSELPPSNPPPAQDQAPLVLQPLPAPPTFDTRVEREIGPTLHQVSELYAAGRHDDAFRECAELLERSRFTAFDPGEQRRALRALLNLASPAGATHATRRAYRAGRDRARALVQKLGEPADYEVLGVCQVALGESAEAVETFRQGLALEHARNPQSELCARLAMHTSKIVIGTEVAS